jgi:hypothetical protein
VGNAEDEGVDAVSTKLVFHDAYVSVEYKKDGVYIDDSAFHQNASVSLDDIEGDLFISVNADREGNFFNVSVAISGIKDIEMLHRYLGFCLEQHRSLQFNADSPKM